MPLPGAEKKIVQHVASGANTSVDGIFRLASTDGFLSYDRIMVLLVRQLVQRRRKNKQYTLVF